MACIANQRWRSDWKKWPALIWQDTAAAPLTSTFRTRTTPARLLHLCVFLSLPREGGTPLGRRVARGSSHRRTNPAPVVLFAREQIDEKK
jgi:hypothetical protein